MPSRKSLCSLFTATQRPIRRRTQPGGPIQTPAEILDVRILLSADRIAEPQDAAASDEDRIRCRLDEAEKTDAQSSANQQELLATGAEDGIPSAQAAEARQTNDQPVITQNPTPGQTPTDDQFDELSFAIDQIPELAGTDPAEFLRAFEDLFSEYAQAGGLDGRDPVSDGGAQDPNREPGTIGGDAFGGWYSGPGSASDEDAKEEPSWLDKAAEWLGIGDDDSGEVGEDFSNATGGAVTGTGVAVDGIKSQSPTVGSGAGKVAGGIFGFLAGIFTANTDSPESKKDEFNGWATFLAAAKGKAPITGGSSMDEDTATAVRGEDAEVVETDDELTEDRLAENESLPPHLRDPSEGWGDHHDDVKWELATGGGVTDPNPMADTAASIDGPPPSTDPTDLVADYVAPVRRTDVTSAPKDNRDWEY